MQEQIMVICAWCKKIEKPGTLPASHGICDECAAKLQEEIDEIVEHDDHGQRLANRDWAVVDSSIADCSPVVDVDSRD